MDLVSGKAAMEYWEISPEELAGVAIAFHIPCFNPETYEEVIPPPTLALEIICDEAAFALKASIKLMKGGAEIPNFNFERSSKLIQEYESIMYALKNNRTVRKDEVEEINKLLFSTEDLYYWICNVKVCGSISTCSKIKKIESLKYKQNNSLVETKDVMFFLAGYQTQMFDDLKATLRAMPNIDQISNEFKKITSLSNKENEQPSSTCISGSALIRRWDGSTLDIRMALREGAIVPVNKLPGKGTDCGPRRTKAMDPCLYCEDGPVGGKCDALPKDDHCPGRTPEEQLFRIRHEIFLLDEVERYEERMGFNYAQGPSLGEGEAERQTNPAVGGERPTTAAEYVAMRKKEGSIPDGQIMLEVQDRWGRPPNKSMSRAEIAALVLGGNMSQINDRTIRTSFENAFKDRVKRFVRNQPQNM